MSWRKLNRLKAPERQTERDARNDEDFSGNTRQEGEVGQVSGPYSQ